MGCDSLLDMCEFVENYIKWLKAVIKQKGNIIDY